MNYFSSISRLLLFVLLLSTAHLRAQTDANRLAVKSPATAGISSVLLDSLTTRLNDSIPCLGSFLIWKQGGLVYEQYFHGADSSTDFNIKSVTKSVVSALAGIAIQKGLLADLKTPVVKFFPEFSKSRTRLSTVWFAQDKRWNDSVRNKLTLYDLLTMQHGWDWNDFSGPVNVFINAADPIRFTMDIPFADTPGTKFLYSSAAASLFGAAVEKAVHTNLKSFAAHNLLQPAGMHCNQWDTDPVGRTIGCSEMYLTPRDMMRFGLLYLHGGKNGGRQVIPAKWVDASLAQHAVLNYWDILPGANGYGYYWWRRMTNGHQAYIASGAGGQIVTVIPDFDMVIVASCFLNQYNRGRSELQSLHEFVDWVTGRVK